MSVAMEDRLAKLQFPLLVSKEVPPIVRSLASGQVPEQTGHFAQRFFSGVLCCECVKTVSMSSMPPSH